ncbi:MAG: LacI family DNA-binding transcriptional regulator [Rhodospirillales bacterium]|nr:LacI family DNA-binding transcriptional regulator [Rhodospirillales bacterium]
MTSNKLPTLADVARVAGLSRATVSRYVNNPDAVRPDRQTRIEKAINELGYVPHGAARALASQRSRMIGALFPSLDSFLFGSFIGPLQSSLRRLGYTLVVSSSDYSSAMEVEQLRALVQNGVDAIVLIGVEHDKRCFELLNRRNITYVLAWSWIETADFPQVGFCNAGATALAANYLIDIGHRKIAMISGITKGNDRASERVRGVQESLSRRGLTLPPDCLIERPFDIREGATAFRELMTFQDPPTAVLCGSDIFAYGALFEASRMCMRVPDDVSITGFDDTDLARNLAPTLTTIRTPRVEMAEMTAEYLLAALSDQGVPRPQKLDVELVIRESTAPPKSIDRGV